jgi:flagellar motor switch protein FliN/FliY
MSETILSASAQEVTDVTPVVSPVAWVDFGGSDASLESDPPVEEMVDLRLVLGGTCLPTAAFERLDRGSIVPLDESVDTPVSILANGRLLARGELVAVDNHYALRITELGSDFPKA